MAKVKLRSLYLSGLASFVSGQHVQFPSSGVMLLEGVSGSGKSSVMNAVAYALGICRVPATKLQTTVADMPLEVRLEIEVDGKSCEVRRGKTLMVVVDGVEVPGRSADKELALDKLLGMPRAMVAARTYLPQGAGGVLLSRPDSERRRVLTALMGLDEFDQPFKLARELVQVVDAEINLSRGAVAQLQRDLDSVVVQEVPDSLGVDADVKQGEARELACRNAYQEAMTASKRLELRHDNELEVLSGRVARLKAERAGLLVVVGRERQEQELNRQEVSRLAQNFAARRSRLLQVASKAEGEALALPQVRSLILGLSGSFCGFCLQPWVDNQAKLQEQQDRERYLEGKVREATAYRAAANSIQIPTIQDSVPPSLSLLEAAETRLASCEREYSTLAEIGRRRHSEQMRLLLGLPSAELRVSTEALEDLKQKQSMVHHQISEVTLRNKLSEQQCLVWRKEMDDQTTKLANLEEKLSAVEDLRSAISTFPAELSAEMLSAVMARANDIISHIPNVSGFTLEMVPEDGKMLATVKSQDRSTTFDQTISGGQQTSLDRAVDLAVMAEIGCRTGVELGWLFIDEGFNGCGSAEKEAFLGVLQGWAVDRLVVLTDHDSTFKEMFAKVVKINFDGSCSWLDQDMASEKEEVKDATKVQQEGPVREPVEGMAGRLLVQEPGAA